MNQIFGNHVILTTDDIRRWQEEIDKAERVKAEAEATIADRCKKLEAAAVLGGTLHPAPLPPDPDSASETLHAAVERIGLGFDRSVQHHEIQAELRKTPRFAEMLDKHKAAYYYTVINRLKKDGKIKKAGRKLRFVHKNEAPPEGNPEGAA